ncbi:hypothetical protein [Desulfuribacillus alkaliarsenatis]|uniref:Uncharacterized protein n=1 Tax=Desulfuribacillus alkaliarsenatis TaxID=766136 RepID=A0A1E5G6G7_9FIRM|nr:hypothetical protein [Desulfuribacillus alkaliarsenatis]OEF98695.1 hypothetical protein BHF68_03275 [Desulfuribacillus alkaliarsenatis]
MLAFGRGIFTAAVVSTFILLLVSFYPTDIHETLAINNNVHPTVVQNSQIENIDAKRIMDICKELDIRLAIKRIILEDNELLEIHYTIDNARSDYGLFDSYKLAQEIFLIYNQLNKMSFNVYIDSVPIIQATINKSIATTNVAAGTSNQDLLNEIQQHFSIILLSN